MARPSNLGPRKPSPFASALFPSIHCDPRVSPFAPRTSILSRSERRHSEPLSALLPSRSFVRFVRADVSESARLPFGILHRDRGHHSPPRLGPLFFLIR